MTYKVDPDLLKPENQTKVLVARLNRKVRDMTIKSGARTFRKEMRRIGAMNRRVTPARRGVSSYRLKSGELISYQGRIGKDSDKPRVWIVGDITSTEEAPSLEPRSKAKRRKTSSVTNAIVNPGDPRKKPASKKRKKKALPVIESLGARADSPETLQEFLELIAQDMRIELKDEPGSGIYFYWLSSWLYRAAHGDPEKGSGILFQRLVDWGLGDKPTQDLELVLNYSGESQMIGLGPWTQAQLAGSRRYQEEQRD